MGKGFDGCALETLKLPEVFDYRLVNIITRDVDQSSDHSLE